MLPFLLEEKSNHIDFWSLTKNDGVRSLLKGERPFHSRPVLRSRTRRLTTSETGRRAAIVQLQDLEPRALECVAQDLQLRGFVLDDKYFLFLALDAPRALQKLPY